eukprot:359869-Chlamydomonas_euryale.AAC.14
MQPVGAVAAGSMGMALWPGLVAPMRALSRKYEYGVAARPVGNYVSTERVRRRPALTWIGNMEDGQPAMPARL